MKLLSKGMAILILSSSLWILMPVHGQTNDFAIIPAQANDGKATTSVEAVGKNGGNVWTQYNQEAKKLSLGDQMASGIMTRNTLLDYVVYIVRFLSQLGLLIGGIMIIYAGYMYATEIFGGKPASGKSAITNAIIGILVIAFSYAIMKLLTSALLS